MEVCFRNRGSSQSAQSTTMTIDDNMGHTRGYLKPFKESHCFPFCGEGKKRDYLGYMRKWSVSWSKRVEPRVQSHYFLLGSKPQY